MKYLLKSYKLNAAGLSVVSTLSGVAEVVVVFLSNLVYKVLKFVYLLVVMIIFLFFIFLMGCITYALCCIVFFISCFIYFAKISRSLFEWGKKLVSRPDMPDSEAGHDKNLPLTLHIRVDVLKKRSVFSFKVCMDNFLSVYKKFAVFSPNKKNTIIIPKLSIPEQKVPRPLTDAVRAKLVSKYAVAYATSIIYLPEDEVINVSLSSHGESVRFCFDDFNFKIWVEKEERITFKFRVPVGSSFNLYSTANEEHVVFLIEGLPRQRFIDIAHKACVKNNLKKKNI